MKCDEARYFIQGILNELNSTFKIPNRFVLNVYRDGGSMDISIKTDGYDNIVFVAPVAFGYGKEASIDFQIATNPRCIAGAAFADFAREGNKDLSGGFFVSEDRGRISMTVFGDE